MNILISPHPDDELIGAYTLLKERLIGKVVYLDAISIPHLPRNSDDNRRRYAERCGEKFGFDVEFIKFEELLGILQNSEHTYLVPDIADRHLLHKAVNCIGRLSGCHLGYYTTDMNTGYTKELSVEDKKKKRELLTYHYPDQSSLWEHDWKYFLFEGVVVEFT